jgi:hypothetical protein
MWSDLHMPCSACVGFLCQPGKVAHAHSCSRKAASLFIAAGVHADLGEWPGGRLVGCCLLPGCLERRHRIHDLRRQGGHIHQATHLRKGEPCLTTPYIVTGICCKASLPCCRSIHSRIWLNEVMASNTHHVCQLSSTPDICWRITKLASTSYPRRLGPRFAALAARH